MTEKEADIKQVLVADDDDLLLGMYRSKFEERGIEMIPARTGQEAMEKLRQYRDSLDCLVLDIIMPDMNGLEMLEIARAEGLTDGKSVVILSNQGGGQDIARAQQLAAQGYIVKATSTPSEVVEQIIELHQKFNSAGR